MHPKVFKETFEQIELLKELLECVPAGTVACDIASNINLSTLSYAFHLKHIMDDIEELLQTRIYDEDDVPELDSIAETKLINKTFLRFYDEYHYSDYDNYIVDVLRQELKELQKA